MERRSSLTNQAPPQSNKIFVVLVGSAQMAGHDALLLSLEKFKNILGSESAQTRFETTVRSIQPSIAAVDAFIDGVYAEKNPMMAVTMTGRTLIVEVDLSKDIFLECVNTKDIYKILSRITAVGSMPAKKLPQQKMREYLSFPVKYEKGTFKKITRVS